MAANQLLTDQKITFEITRLLENNLKFAPSIVRGYDDQFGRSGAKIGYTLNIRKPSQFDVRIGQAVDIQPIEDIFVPLTLTTQAGVDLEISSADWALSIDDFSERYLKTQIMQLANRVDSDGLLFAYQATPNIIGSAGSVPNTSNTYLAVGQRLTEMACPMDDRCMLITPGMNTAIVPALQGLFNAPGTISKQYRSGMMAEDTLGFDWYVDQNIYEHQAGPLGGSPLVNNSGQTGSNLVTDGWTAAAALRLRQGDVISIGTAPTAVYAVNPRSRRSTGSLANFVVTADVFSDGSGNATIPIYPPIIPSGPYQNVTQSPTDGMAINVLTGTSGQRSMQAIGFHKEAFALAFAPLPLYEGLDRRGYMFHSKTGIKVRFIRDYDVRNDQLISRLDILYGYAAIYPNEMSCRLIGS